MMRPTMLLAAAALALSQTVAAQDLPGDPQTGRRLAENWCRECHAVDARSASAHPSAPDFAAVAARPGTTALSLNVFLRSSHKTMPNLMMERREADDLVAYILSLQR
jgi:mono/diheme cytochrome c family protein